MGGVSPLSSNGGGAVNFSKRKGPCVGALSLPGSALIFSVPNTIGSPATARPPKPAALPKKITTARIKPAISTNCAVNRVMFELSNNLALPRRQRIYPGWPVMKASIRAVSAQKRSILRINSRPVNHRLDGQERIAFQPIVDVNEGFA